MASFELDTYVPEGVLELDNKDEQMLHSQARWEMFMNVLNEAKVITVAGSKMIESIITEKNDPQNKYYDKTCFKSTFGKAGPVGFKNSYSKTC